MSLKVTTILEKTLDEMIHESFELYKQVMDCHFSISRGNAVTKKKLDQLKPHIEKLKALEANLP